MAANRTSNHHSLRHRACCTFKKARASCWRKTHCVEVRSMAAAPLRRLGPRFRGGNEGKLDPDHRTAGKPIALRSAPWKGPDRGPKAPALARETTEDRGGRGGVTGEGESG